MRSCASALLAAAGLVVASVGIALAGDAPSTTRIETRPFYGATVTLEEGVRVFRPLPPHHRVIINPGAKASVSLGFEEHVNRHYNYNQSAAPVDHAGNSGGGSPIYGGATVDGTGAHRPNHGHRPGGIPAGPAAKGHPHR